MLALTPAFTNLGIPRGLLELRLSPNDRFSSSPLFHYNKIKSGHLLPPLSFHMFAYFSLFSFCSAVCIFFLESNDGMGRRRVLGVLMEWNQWILWDLNQMVRDRLFGWMARLTQWVLWDLNQNGKRQAICLDGWVDLWLVLAERWRNSNRYEIGNFWGSGSLKFSGRNFGLKETGNSGMSELVAF